MGLGMDATFGDDFSVVNLPANLLFKQIELYVGNTNVYTSHFVRYFWFLLSKTLQNMRLSKADQANGR